MQHARLLKRFAQRRNAIAAPRIHRSNRAAQFAFERGGIHTHTSPLGDIQHRQRDNDRHAISRDLAEEPQPLPQRRCVDDHADRRRRRNRSGRHAGCFQRIAADTRLFILKVE
jgi:hypothetical protein